nr:selenium cofactor biosynthesis protein YqeC [uncultured Mediterraneibacter sp.]
MIYIYSEGRMKRADSLRQALELEDTRLREQRPVISVVGAGGKTTMLRRLADEYMQTGTPVFVTTTTHIMNEDRPWFVPGTSEEKIREVLQKYGQVWAGMPAPGRKLGILPESLLKTISRWKIPILIEADGARRLPVKVPSGYEPVIRPDTTHVLSVYGLDGVGKRIEDAVFRPELAEALLNKKRTECIAARDIAILASSDFGGRKGCPQKAVYTVVLNKVDYEEHKKTALAICRALEEKGIHRVIVTGRDNGEVREADTGK